MRPITISLDATTWELAKKKSNFSAWVRAQLRSERNRMEGKARRIDVECVYQCGRAREPGYVCCNTCIPVSLKYNDEEMMSNGGE
jgi:hypothetical protein